MIRRVFVSFLNPDILDERRKNIQNKLIEKIKDLGFQPEMFFLSGSAASMAWSLQNVIDIMKRCMGAVVVAFPRWEVMDEGIPRLLASEYAQIEGTVAVALNLPLFILAEKGIVDRGLTWTGAGNPILYIPSDATTEWFNSDAFKHRFGVWTDQLKNRRDIFLGYSSKAKSTATSINLFLREKLNLNVLDWKSGFSAAGIIIDEIETASRLCSGGIFLFTKDDFYNGDESNGAPRDNVVFEAGYFAAARGREKVLIILEEGAKIPADLGGNIYLNLNNREDISSLESSIRDFVEKRL